MCSNVGNQETQTKPTYEEMAVMGCDKSMCAGCELYGWYSMMDEWQPLDGWCSIKTRLGNVRADALKCDYFVKRGDV